MGVRRGEEDLVVLGEMRGEGFVSRCDGRVLCCFFFKQKTAYEIGL